MRRLKVSTALVGVVFSTLPNRFVSESTTGPQTAAHVSAPLVNGYEEFPLAFEPNLGQVDDSVKYLSHGDGYIVALTADAAVLRFTRPTVPRATPRSPITTDAPAERVANARTTIRMMMVGANPGGTLSGCAPLATRTNYFIGNDPARWRTDVPTFSKVRYENAYPGIDLVVYGRQRALEYDWVVKPGGNPSAIELAFDGVDRVELDADGDLLESGTGSGDVVRQRRPVAYQEVSGRKTPIDVGYTIERDHHVKLWTSQYDRRISLVIDPVLEYGTYLGGSGDDWASAATVDRDGRAYIAGETNSADFPLNDPIQPTIGADSAVFVAKLTRDGSGLEYATYLGGGSGNQGASGLAVDNTGHAYVTGNTTATNFPVTPGAFQMAPGGGSCSDDTCADAFVVKLSASGSALEYSSYLGGSKNDGGHSVAIDPAGNAYVTGYTLSPDFPFTPGAFQQGRNRSKEFFGAFVVKVNAEGRALVYAAYLDDAEGTGIVVDASGYAYVTGNATDNHPTTPGAFQTTSGYTFVTKLSPDGAALAYSTRLGGGSTGFWFPGFFYDEVEQARAIAIDSAGHAYTTGFTDFPDFPTTPGAFSATPPCNGANINPVVGQPFYNDAFVAKLSADGTALEYSTYIGGCLNQVGGAIAVDTTGNAYVAGSTNAADFPITLDAVQNTLASGTCHDGSSTYVCSDAFVIKLNSIGSELLYSTYLGGPGDDGANGLAVDANGRVYIAGSAGQDFPTTRDGYQPLFGGVDTWSFAYPLFNGGGDAFVTRLNVGLSSPEYTLRGARRTITGGVSQRAPASGSGVRAPRPRSTRIGHR